MICHSSKKEPLFPEQGNTWLLNYYFGFPFPGFLSFLYPVCFHSLTVSFHVLLSYLAALFSSSFNF